MNIVDIILLILFVIGAFFGYKKGLILELISIAAFILAIYGGFKLLHIGMEYVSRVYEGFGTLLPFVAFLVLFVLIIIVVNIIGKILKKIIDWTPLGIIDNIAGALIGILKWAVAVTIFIWVITVLNLDFDSQTLNDSKILAFTNKVLNQTIEFIGTIFPSFKDFISTIKELFETFAT